MASQKDGTLHWCTEEIPIGSDNFLQFDQSLTEPHFLGELKREPSWIGALPTMKTDSFDIARLKYLVPTLRRHKISSSDMVQIKKELIIFSQYLLQPDHAFIHLFSNFDFCDSAEFFPNDRKYVASLPLKCGNIINKDLILRISELMKENQVKSLTICEDMSRTGIGLRSSYPKQYDLKQSRFVIRANVEFKYPSKYMLDEDAFDVLIMDEKWLDYVQKVQAKIIDKDLITVQQEKLWKPFLIKSNASQSDDDVENKSFFKHASDKKAIKQMNWSPFTIYDFAQNEYSSTNGNMSDIISSLSYSAREALKCANMQRSFDEKISHCQVFMELSLNDACDSKPIAYVYRMDIVKTQNINSFVKQLDDKNQCVGSLIVHIIQQNIDEYHKDILLSEYCVADDFVEIIEKIFVFLKLKNDQKRTNILLLQERAIIVLADVIWQFYKRFYAQFVEWINGQNLEQMIRENISFNEGNIKQMCNELQSLKQQKPSNKNNDDDAELIQYYGFLEPFLKASNEKELQDFNECAKILLAEQHIAKNDNIKYNNIETIYRTESGMRVGISSANASDNWTNSKLNGGVTINMSINLDSIKATPVMCKVQIIPNNVVIELSTTHTMRGDVQTDKIVFSEKNIADFLKIDDNKDVFRMLKYALIFVGIVNDPHSQSDDNYSSILEDISKFTGGHGLSLSVANLGPSRSGFASSSAVACNLLKVLYVCSGNDIANNDELLGSMALLLENRLGLKSGRQDVDGLLPNGIKVLHYHKTTGFVSPKISFLSKDRFNVKELGQNMILVNSGIARASGLGLHRGLNMRFLAYLSRDPTRFKAILQSYKIHDEIIKALQFNNYCLLGKLFLDYMSCRERIDPGATQSKYDKDNKDEKVLRKLFDPLVENGLIFGGMFTGAMGGGVAMLSLTPFAKQMYGGGKITNIEHALNELRQWKTEKGSIPFQRLSRIEYSVNVDGILLTQIKKEKKKIDENVLIKKEYLFKSMNAENMTCLDADFSEIVLSLKDVSDEHIKSLKKRTDLAKKEGKDINIIVIETRSKNDIVTLQSISCKEG